MMTPLIELAWVNRSVPDLWFMHPDGTKSEWKEGSVAFDLDGRFLGIESVAYPLQGIVFIHAKLVHSLWTELLAGTNIDRVRLVAQPIAPQLWPAESEATSAEAERRAVAATVRIRTRPGHTCLSGVIISKEGLVATVAHHFVMPGGTVTVSLPDGRDLPGEVIGSSFPSDIGLVRIKSIGEFPFVKMGRSTSLRPGDDCVVIGYGPVADELRTPQIRRPKVVEPSGGLWSHMLPLDPSVMFTGGDCGGGVFDVQGRLIAVACPYLGQPWPHENPRIEILRKQWDSLHASFDQATKSDFANVEKVCVAAADRLRDAVVELRQGDQTFALGTVADISGTIVSKASALPATGRHA
jgi:hypothetical protein